MRLIEELQAQVASIEHAQHVVEPDAMLATVQLVLHRIPVEPHRWSVESPRLYVNDVVKRGRPGRSRSLKIRTESVERGRG